MKLTQEKLKQIIKEEVRQTLLVEQMKKDLLQEGLVDYVKKFFDEDYYENMVDDLEGGEVKSVLPPPKKVKKKDEKLFFDLPGKRRVIQLALIGLLAGGVANTLGQYASSYDPAEVAAAEQIRDGFRNAQDRAQRISNFRQAATAEGESVDINQHLDQLRNRGAFEQAPISPGRGMMVNGKFAKAFVYIPADQIPDDQMLPMVGMTKADYEYFLRMGWLLGDTNGDERLRDYVIPPPGSRGSSIFWAYTEGGSYSPVLDVENSDDYMQQKMKDLYGENADQILILPLEWSVAYDLLQKRAGR